MTYKPPEYQNYKQARRKKKIYQPLILGGLAILFIAVGLVLVYLYLNDARVSLSFLYTDTPTATATATPPPASETPTTTLTPSMTPIPTDAPTGTASAPFTYVVQSGDSLFSIAEKFDIEDTIIIMVMNGLTDLSVIFPGDELVIPDPNALIPTPTNIPSNLKVGDVIDYMVLPGDTAQLIAERFASTIEAIQEETQKIYGDTFDINTIYPGQILRVPVRLLTPTFGPPPTDPPTETITPELPTATETATTGP